MTARRWTDAELNRKCRQSDPVAWHELVRRHATLVYRLSVKMLRDPAEAEDASQEAFMRVHRSFDSHDPTRPLAPWISRITYNVCLRRLESRTKKAAVAGVERDAQGDVRDQRTPSPEQQTATHEAHRILGDAFDSLSTRDRALLTLRYREGMSDAEVADAVDMPINTVKTRIFRARRTLRDQLAPTLESPSDTER